MRGILLFLFSCTVALGVFMPQGIFADTANVTISVLLRQCGDGIDNDGDGDIDYPADAGCESYSDNTESSDTFEEIIPIDTTQAITETHSPSGKTSITIALPANVIASGEELKMTVVSKTQAQIAAAKPVPTAKVAAGTVFEIDFVKTSDSTSVASLDKSVTLTFAYTDADVVGIDESTLKAYRWDGSAWSELSGSTVDASANTVTATTQNFSTFSLLGSSSSSEDTTPTTTTTSGGGGGGIVPPSRATVYFKGYAYPESDVVLLRNAQAVATTRANPNAAFQFSLSDLSSGTHTFGVWSEDKTGSRSITHTFTVAVTSGASVIISGIFLPPTITSDKTTVRRGDVLTLFGNATPSSQVTVIVNSSDEITQTVQAEQSGAWLYRLDTLSLERGEHSARARAAKGDEITTLSQALSFIVGDKNIARPTKVSVPTKVDFNGDGKINLVDFSIAAYWYKRESPPERVDANTDGKVDLVDFSILAFYWTG